MQTLLAVVFSSAGCANSVASQNLIVCLCVWIVVCVSYSNSLFICVFKKYFSLYSSVYSCTISLYINCKTVIMQAQTPNELWPSSPPLDNIRVMMIVCRLRGNIIRTALCWVVWHNVHSQQHTYMSSSYRSSRLGMSHWNPYAMQAQTPNELWPSSPPLDNIRVT